MNQPIIDIRNLTRKFGRATALDDITLQVAQGLVFGLVGENGAGKTTLIKHVLGLLKPQQGSVAVFGLDPLRDPVGALGRIGYLSEDRDLPAWMRVSELMSYSQAFYPRWDCRFAEELRGMFELDGGQKIRRLSRGQRARAGLLVALAHRPDLLVLDEPSSGLDPIVRRDILGAIIRTVSDEGRTVVFSSHLLDEVERVADSVCVLDHGRTVLTDSLERLLGAHSRVTVRFDKALTSVPSLPGALSIRGDGRDWTVIANGAMDQLVSAATGAGATIVEQSRPSLEEVFFARVQNRARAITRSES
jgi:ABC-2 type transport system ATP-binding protein